MKIHASAEDYLERILMLKKEKGYVRSIDIAHSLNFSKPSVSIAMKKLLENGLIEINDSSYIELTEEGKRIATNIYEKHEIISSILIKLGVNEKIAKIDACKIEHDLSEESFNALKIYYEKKIK